MFKKTILIVEDDVLVATNIKTILNRKGYIADEICTDGETAIKKIKKNKPDLIIIDTTLRGKMNGLEAAAKIKKIYNVPLIFTTSLPNEEIMNRMKISEPSGYIIKPFSDKRLLFNVELSLYKHELEISRKKQEKLHKTLYENSPTPILHLDLGVLKQYLKKNFENLEIDKIKKILRNNNEKTLNYIDKIKIVVVNHELIKLLEGKNLDYLQKNYKNLINKDFLNNFINYFIPIIKTNNIDSFESSFKTLSGKLKWVNIKFSKLNDDKQNSLEFIATLSDITKLKQREKQLEFQSNILNRIRDHVIATDTKGKIIYTNDIERKTLGLSRSKIIGQSIDILGENTLKGATQKEILEKTFKHGRWKGDVVNYTKKGQEIVFNCRTSVIKDNKGKINTLIGISTDVTKLRKTESKLKKNEERLHSIFESSPLGIIYLNNKGKLLKINPAFTKITGISPENILGKKIAQIIKKYAVPEITSNLLNQASDLLAGKTLENFEIKYKEKILEIIFPQKDKGKIGITVLIQDITKRKKIEDSLKASMQKNEALLNSIPDFMFEFNKKGDFLSYKGNRKDLYLPPSQFINKNVAEVLPEELAKKTLIYLEKTFETSSKQVYEYELKIKGKKHYYENRMVKIENDSVLAIIRDISSEKETEGLLQSSEKKYRNLIENLHEGISSVDENENFTFLNKAAAKIFGYPKKELLHKNLKDITYPKEYKKILKQTQERKKGKSSEYELEITKKNGEKSIVNMNCSPIFNKKGEYKGALGLTTDITQQKLLQKQLQVSEKKYKILFNSSTDAIFLMDEDEIIDCNLKATDLLNCKKDKIVGKSFLNFAPIKQSKIANSREIFIRKTNLSTKDKKDFFDWQYKDAFNKTFYAELSLNRIYLQNKYFTQAIMHDISARKHTENIQKALYNISKAVNSTEDISNLYEKIRQELNNVIDTTNFYVALYNEDEGIMTLPYMADEYDNFRSFPKGKTLSAYVLNQGKPLFVTETLIRKLIKSGEVETIGSPSKLWLGAPLKIGKNIIGLIVVQSYRNANLYTKKDLDILSFVSDEIARAIERKHSIEKIKQSLKEKTTLLQEIHHRIKNNMQVLASLLSLQYDYLKDSRSKEMFHECMDRIQSMAYVHENLYQSKDLSNIEFENYLQDMILYLRNSYPNKTKTINIKTQSKNIFVNISIAIPLGLIINELVTNSLKYAFPNDRKGEIIVKLIKTKNLYKLSVGDNGIGFPKNIDFRDSSNFGLRLVVLMGENQIGGKINLDRSKGTKFTITWKEMAQYKSEGIDTQI